MIKKFVGSGKFTFTVISKNCISGFKECSYLTDVHYFSPCLGCRNPVGLPNIQYTLTKPELKKEQKNEKKGRGSVFDKAI